MTEQYLKDLVEGINKIWEENRAVENKTINREDTFTICDNSQSYKEITSSESQERIEFEYSSCFICNGYYGPCFEDPLCATCHVFLYPNVLPSVAVPSSVDQKSDSDSGNDEPVDSVFRPTNGQENAVISFSSEDGAARHPISVPSLNNYLVIANIRSKNFRSFSPSIVGSIVSKALSLQTPSTEPEADRNSSPDSSSSPTISHSICSRRLAPVIVDNLAQQLQKLSVAKYHIDEVNIELFPPEVLMHTFQYLDEISLWSIGQVCTRWRAILFMCVKPQKWKELTLNRWPLLPVYNFEQDWYELYTSMMLSSCCLKCVRQMAAQELPPNWEDNSWRWHRLKTELRVMRTDPLDGIEATPLDEACCHWQATLEGPSGSSYEGGLFFLYIQVPVLYPLEPPIVRFITKIFHPNISRHGDIGIDSIHQNWSLALTISKLLISIQSLLTDPFCDVCMEPEIGKLYMRNRSAFEAQARSWTMKYAMHDMLPH